MPRLVIYSDAEPPVELVSVRLTIDIDPLSATPVILASLAKIPKPRKLRSDAGKPRTTEEPK